MRGVYGHVTERMLAEVREALQHRWAESLRARAALSPTSAVPVLNAALAALPGTRRPLPIDPSAPKFGHLNGKAPGRRCGRAL